LGGVFLASLLIPPASLGQERGGTGSSAGAKRDTMLSREADIQNRNRILELLSEPGKTKLLSEDDRKLIAKQIFEDFERVQMLNREMLQASSNLDNNSYKRIASLADEMNKRAKRLKINLHIPDVEPEKKAPESPTEIDATQLKASLRTLNGSVTSFVNSPIFKDPRITTVGHLQTLRKDISNVIELSRTVKKTAGKLNK